MKSQIALGRLIFQIKPVLKIQHGCLVPTKFKQLQKSISALLSVCIRKASHVTLYSSFNALFEREIKCCIQTHPTIFTAHHGCNCCGQEWAPEAVRLATNLKKKSLGLKNLLLYDRTVSWMSWHACPGWHHQVLASRSKFPLYKKKWMHNDNIRLKTKNNAYFFRMCSCWCCA